MPTVSDILKEANGFDLLKEVEILLCDYLKIDSSKLFLLRTECLEPEIFDRISSDIGRLRAGYPLAYLRGKADFYGLSFIVNENVLIPRRETEILVREAVSCIKKLNGDSTIHMIELGVGSGCISIAVVKALRGSCSASLPGQRFTPDLSQKLAILGIEKSEKALRVAKKNLNTFAMNDVITFKKGDLLEGVEGDFDILVANLPYVDHSSELGKGVREYEPHEALFAEDGGLALYRRVFKQLNEKSIRPKYILFEIGFDQGEGALRMCNEFLPKYEVSILKDLEGRDRVLKMTSPT